jgi:modification methylase
MSRHRVIVGDSRKMREIADGSVHLIVTSPPYWQLKDYGSSSQIGFHHDYETYINHLNLVWSECDRILAPGCRLCVNIGDQFARSVYYGRYKVIPIRTEITRFCETIGLDYMGAVIWQKVATTNTTGGASIMGSFPYPRNGILKLDYEFILIFKKPGKPPQPTKEQKEASKMTTREWNEYFSGHWNFPGARQQEHLAMFPEELPRRLIRMFSFTGDTILDPFLGSGTTSLAARNLDRNSVGYEINPGFLPVIKSKLGVGEPSLFEENQFEFNVQILTTEDFEARIDQLPYRFRDPHKLDKKVDVKRLRYGSKIDDSDWTRDTSYLVKDVLSPEVVKLDNGMIVRMIGVIEDTLVNGRATDFLRTLLRGQRVTLKFDDRKYDENQQLCAYVYLANKTMVNAQLIKQGLARVDDSYDYRFRAKFLKIEQTGSRAL